MYLLVIYFTRFVRFAHKKAFETRVADDSATSDEVVARNRLKFLGIVVDEPCIYSIKKDFSPFFGKINMLYIYGRYNIL